MGKTLSKQSLSIQFNLINHNYYHGKYSQHCYPFNSIQSTLLSWEIFSANYRYTFSSIQSTVSSWRTLEHIISIHSVQFNPPYIIMGKTLSKLSLYIQFNLMNHIITGKLSANNLYPFSSVQSTIYQHGKYSQQIISIYLVQFNQPYYHHGQHSST